MASLALRRCCNNSGVGGRAGSGIWPSVRHKCFTGIAVLPNTTHGANGPTRWHMEASGQRRLRPSTGKD